MRKKVTNGVNIKTTDYLDGFQYNEQVLEFFPTSEGYVKATPTGLVPPGTPPSAYAFNYVFNYTDHLGNVRVSYTKDPQTRNLKILDESHYYPFGLKHQEYSTFGFVSNPIQGVIIAPVASGIFGNLVDTAAFFFIAFYKTSDAYLSENLVEIGTVDYIFKMLISGLFFLPLYKVILDRIIQKMKIDSKT